VAVAVDAKEAAYVIDLKNFIRCPLIACKVGSEVLSGLLKACLTPPRSWLKSELSLAGMRLVLSEVESYSETSLGSALSDRKSGGNRSFY
jgi:hypothetical protein